ncbi:hypothetical protein F4779DRAFT_563231 [Xylariaceae sp. FL0662B]|nr:hypothetical protein F4779DRAFT_563231 [Xylariaceae sp. FL0662B]
MLNAMRGRKQKFSPRPLYATVFVFTLITVYCVFVRGSPTPLDNQQDLFARSGQDCRLVQNAEDKCDFVRRNCQDDEAGLFDYLTLYYCDLGRVQPVAFIILVLWLGLLFTTIGIAASDFFSVNLSTIATILGLSESLAGVTFLAFGNGSPDVFSTFAAMGSNSGSMAVGELIGAAGFITSVVAGSMALVREFKVGTNTYVRDILFFVAAVSFAMVFLSDGNLHLWECSVMISFYLFYVVVVVGWHAYDKRRSTRRAKEALSRSHFYASGSNRTSDELEPYRDEPGNEGISSADRLTVDRDRPATMDAGILERGPRIEVGALDGHETLHHSQHIAAEMASSMRVSRPRWKRSATTITPIRPSLVGALEFRSVLSSLQQESNVHMRPVYHARSSSADLLDGGRYNTMAPAVQGTQSTHSIRRSREARVVTRSRALSSGAVPASLDADLIPRDSSDDRGRASHLHTIGGKLAPPPTDQSGSLLAEGSITEGSPGGPQVLHVPSPHGSDKSSSPLSPFPIFTDSPSETISNQQQPPHLVLPPPAVEEHSAFPHLVERVDSKPVRWWPYQLLPPPRVLFGTLFPTLQGWRSKGIWDKLISIISVPSIFLLVITLPVVESEITGDEPEDNIAEQPASGRLNNTATPVSFEPNGVIEPETEWQRYRRNSRSRGASRSRSPTIISVDLPGDAQGSAPNQAIPVLPSIDAQTPKPASELGQADSVLTDEEQGWNRWLLILQIFTGPLFCVFIVWANMAEELDRPVMVLVRALLISLVCSLVLLGFLLLTTSPYRRPRYHALCCFLGFFIAIAWISTIAGEVVGVLKAFGVILDISEAILGLTVFAVGNSVGDLVADVTVARLGYPVMALSACFGGPLLNILLGIGLGGAYQTIKAANKEKGKHPESPMQYKPYHLQVSGTLMISTVTLLVTLLILLVVVPMNKWIMSRKIGWGLIALWSISTAANVAIEITGVWQDIA